MWNSQRNNTRQDKTLTKECWFSWMGREFLPERNQNNMTGHLCQDAMTLLPLAVYVSGLFRCWLTCERKYHCSGGACKHLILNVFLVKIWTLMRVCCGCKHARCHASLTNSLRAFGYLLPRRCFSIPSHPEHTVGKALRRVSTGSVEFLIQSQSVAPPSALIKLPVYCYRTC